MKRMSALVFAILLSSALVACSGSDDGNTDKAQASASATTQETTTNTAAQADDGSVDSKTRDFSYALGMDIANSLGQIDADVDPGQVAQGLTDALAGNNTRITQDEARQILQAKAQELQAKQVAAHDQQAKDNLKASEAFLAKHKQEEGVKVTDSGLQYKVLREGDGPKPTTDDTVVVDYKGTLPDGSVFDSSYARGKPATFPVNAVIPGWTEALQMMRVGSKYELVIPPDLAYGEQGAGQAIGPNEALMFEVELKAIEKPDADAGPDKAEPQHETDTDAQ